MDRRERGARGSFAPREGRWLSSRHQRATGVSICVAATLLLPGCSTTEQFPETCGQVRAQEQTLRAQATAAEGAPEQDRVAAERRWAELVVGEPDCFSAEKVVIARTVLQPPF